MLWSLDLIQVHATDWNYSLSSNAHASLDVGADVKIKAFALGYFDD